MDLPRDSGEERAETTPSGATATTPTIPATPRPPEVSETVPELNLTVGRELVIIRMDAMSV